MLTIMLSESTFDKSSAQTSIPLEGTGGLPDYRALLGWQ
jgi:hypothetical protein